MRAYMKPPAAISHSGRDLKLVTSDVPFRCDGCNELGCGPRYTDDGDGGSESKSFDLHTCCAHTEDTLVHPLFPNFTFRFLKEPPPPVKGTICDACGQDAHGFVYHCFEEELDLHPCCASLPPRIILEGRVFDLLPRARRKCGYCSGDNGRRSRAFWAYRTYFDGEAVPLHVACMKDMTRLRWDTEAYLSQNGGGQIFQATSSANIDLLLQSLSANKRCSSGFDQFIDIVGTVARIIIAVIFGNPVAMIAAVAGHVPC